ncbi:MAG TPA: ABC transporter permease [Bryobacteraceae bacterium]
MSKRDDRLREEIEAHLQMAIRDRIERGEPAAQAEAAARREFGNELLIQETTRETWGWMWVDRLVQDFRFALRLFQKNCAFVVFAILVLALGIGATTAVFSFVNAILLRPLPYKDADRLVAVYENYPANGWLRSAVAAPMLEAWRRQTTVFEGLGARRWATARLALTGLGSPETLTGTQVSANVFQLLGVRPSLGQDFLPENEIFGKHHVVLLSHEFWQRRFGGDAGIVGKAIALNSEPTIVIGVMPPGTHFPRSGIDVWQPVAFEPWELGYRHAHNYVVLGKLKPGVSLAQANQELRVIAARMAAADGESKGWGAEVHGLQDDMVGDTRPVLLVLLTAVGLVLLIGCANIANLLLAHSTARVREFSIRLALGAGRGRLIRQLLVESLLLCAAGGLAGWLLAEGALAGLIRLSPPDLPRVSEGIHLDGLALAFTALVTLTTGLLFGLAPAWEALNPALERPLTGNARATAGIRRGRLRGALVVAEMTFSVVLLIGAGLMIRSFGRLLMQDVGFNPEQVVTMSIKLPGKQYRTQAECQQFFDQLLARVGSLSGVKASGGVFGLPLSGTIEGQDVEFVDAPPPKPGEVLTADYAQVSPGYFTTMNIPLLEGRDFTDRDLPSAPAALIVSESFIRQFHLGTNVLGRRLRVSDSSKRESEIIGVVKDVKSNDLAAPVRAAMYRTYKQFCRGEMALVIRTERDAGDVTRAVRAEVAQLDKDLPLERIGTMTRLVESSVAQRKLSVQLLTGFAGVALVLAAIGLYGVLAHTVSLRTQEIGIRAALGAQRRSVIGLVIRQGMRLAGLGIVLGVAGAFVLSESIRSLLFGVAPTDPITYILAPALLTGVALVACWLPARRAVKVDPMVALRHES